MSVEKDFEDICLGGYEISNVGMQGYYFHCEKTKKEIYIDSRSIYSNRYPFGDIIKKMITAYEHKENERYKKAQERFKEIERLKETLCGFLQYLKEEKSIDVPKSLLEQAKFAQDIKSQYDIDKNLAYDGRKCSNKKCKTNLATVALFCPRCGKKVRMELLNSIKGIYVSAKMRQLR